MQPDELNRLEALKMAIDTRTPSEPTANIVARAEAFYAFLIKSTR